LTVAIVVILGFIVLYRMDVISKRTMKKGICDTISALIRSNGIPASKERIEQVTDTLIELVTTPVSANPPPNSDNPAQDSSLSQILE